MRLSDAEWKVMHCLWQRSPATAREVLEQLEGRTDWAYTTVKTMLNRLVDKGVLDEGKRAHTSWYTPRLERDEARRSALHGLLDKAFDGAFGTLVHHLVEDQDLSADEREQLRALLANDADPEHDADPEADAAS